MDGNITATRLAAIMAERGLDQSELARRVGCSSAAINQIVTGKTRNSRLLPTIAAKLHVSTPYLLGETKDSSDIALRADESAGGTVSIDMIDLAYGMGGSFLDVAEINSEKIEFSPAYLRKFTAAPPEMLFVAEGIGDSMMPTIHDRDLVIIDRSQRVPEMGEKIWAIMFGEIGMIKRLRPMPDGTVKISSDNQSIRDEIATDGDLHIVGRVVAAVKRL